MAWMSPAESLTTAIGTPSITTRAASFDAELVDGADSNGCHVSSPCQFRLDARLTRRSSSSGEPIFCTISVRKPRTTRRRASSSRMPRAMQVEQVLVVETAGGARVAGAGDVAGLDLEVRHGVGAGAVAEHEVAVLLVAVGAGRVVADQHVADPDGARALALQGALVGDAAAGVRRVVVHEHPLLEVLAGVGEVEAEELDVGALLGEVRRTG